jgi:CHASE1-domain containing sensor protein
MQRVWTVALRWLPLTLIAVLGVALSSYAAFRSAQYEAAQTRASFESQAIREIGAVKARISASLGAVNPSFLLSKSVNHYAATIISNPGLRLLATMRAAEARMLGAAPGWAAPAR